MLELIIDVNKKEEKTIKKIELFENGNLTEYYEDDDNSERKEGNIYIGTIKDVIKGMQSAFVDIGDKKNAFIHLEDILPKEDEVKKDKNKKIPEISQVIKKNQKILVQVKKDATDKKGARVAAHISLSGSYVVLMPNTDIITISKKIEDDGERKRLIDLVKANISKNNGAIIRTSAINKTEEIIKEIKNLESKWEKILEKYEELKEKNIPQLVLENDSIVEKILIDLFDKNICKIITNNKEEYEKVKIFLESNNDFKNIKIELKPDEEIKNLYDVESQIEKLKNRKVWLKCGGFITIDKTEALTAIDVNTGKYTGTKNLEETVFKVNQEATVEIAKQLKLRDIGGIIIVDYIDMQQEENKNKIQNLLIELLKKDRSKTQVEGFTKLDLMEITRKHICSHKD